MNFLYLVDPNVRIDSGDLGSTRLRAYLPRSALSTDADSLSSFSQIFKKKKQFLRREKAFELISISLRIHSLIKVR